MTRTVASRKGSVEQMGKMMKGIVCRTDKGVLDEGQWAYKKLIWSLPRGKVFWWRWSIISNRSSCCFSHGANSGGKQKAGSGTIAVDDFQL
jgi:hypothetical protein